MKNLRHIAFMVVILVIAFYSGTPIFAQKKFMKGDSVWYEFAPVVVTGARYTMPKSNLAASINIISEATLARSTVSNVAEAVSRFTPGAFTTQRTVMGYGVAEAAAGGITIRGLGGTPNTQVLILIDGRPDFMGIFGHPLPDAYPLDYVERIEVLRGPAAAIYGTNALGGVVNIITQDIAEPGFKTKLATGFGNFGTKTYLLQHGAKLGRYAYFTTASYKKSDGHRDNSQFESQSYSLKLAYEVNPHFKVRFFGSTTPYEFHDPGPVNGQPEFEFGDIKRHTLDLTLENKFAKTNGSIKIHGNFGEHDLSDGWHSKDRTMGVVAFQNFYLPHDITTTLELDAKQYGGLGENKKSPAFIQNTLGEQYVTEIAGYAHLQKIFMKKIILGAGARLQNHSVFGSEWIPKIGAVFQPTNRTAIHSSVARGFRSPTARELYFFPSANKELKPEQLWSYEIGVTHTFSRLLALEVDGFQIDAKELIRIDTSVRPNRTLNTGRLKYNGLEATLKSTPFLHFNAKLAYAYFNTDDILPFSPNKLSFWLNYRWKMVSISAFVESVDKLYYGSDTSTELEPYTLIGAKVQAKLIDHLMLALSIENMTDTEYEILKDYPMPGRTFFSKLSYEF